jgi:hypothetical protein
MHDPDLAVDEVAALCGVTKTRVYQRLADVENPLPCVKRAIGAGSRTVTRVPIHAALAWRAERLEHGQAVGPAPLELLDQLLTPPTAPAISPTSVGLPRFTPF